MEFRQNSLNVVYNNRINIVHLENMWRCYRSLLPTYLVGGELDQTNYRHSSMI